MNVAALQFDIAWENKPANFATVRRLLETSRPARGSLVALPEMFATGFSLNPRVVAEPRGGETEKFLAATARDFGVYLQAGVAMLDEKGTGRNRAVVVSPAGEVVASYSKMQPFSPANEAASYTAGEQPVSYRCGEWTVSPFVCYDVRFPEIFRMAVAEWRPELFVVIANFPDRRIHHWTRLLQARAIENQAYVMGVNRIGLDPFYSYNGHSLIIDPQGEIIANGGESEGVTQAALDLDGLRKYREGLQFLADMKPRPNRVRAATA
jgi:predicted amidohydrolase